MAQESRIGLEACSPDGPPSPSGKTQPNLRPARLTPPPPVGYIEVVKELVGDTSVHMSTLFPSKNNIQRNWHVLDADGVVLGRLASKAAMLLMGKTKPIYTPFIDTGDHVIVINADKVRLTGQKEEDKILSHALRLSRRIAGSAGKKMRATRPGRMVELADSRHAAEK